MYRVGYLRMRFAAVFVTGPSIKVAHALGDGFQWASSGFSAQRSLTPKGSSAFLQRTVPNGTRA